MLEIERHPFDRLRSLVATTPMSRGEMALVAVAEPQMQVQGLAQHSTFQSCDDGEPLGPFRSPQEALGPLVEAHLRMIAGDEVGTADNAVCVFLAHRSVVDILDRVGKSAADDKADHTLVNADFDIVGVIDWERCSTASREEAFSSLCMMWPVAAFYGDSNGLADEELPLARVFCERGLEDLVRCVLDGRKVRGLFFALALGGASHEDRRTFVSLFMGLRQAFDPRQSRSSKEEK